jgi:DNA-directed RNA polymerase subunit E'/Rpb7
MYKEMKVERKAEIEPSKLGFDIQTLGLKHLK